mgnify:CR=1 FL=1
MDEGTMDEGTMDEVARGPVIPLIPGKGKMPSLPRWLSSRKRCGAGRARRAPGGARAISVHSFSSKNFALTAKPQLPRTTLTGCGACNSLP